jgi:hypothetical protein
MEIPVVMYAAAALLPLGARAANLVSVIYNYHSHESYFYTFMSQRCGKFHSGLARIFATTLMLAVGQLPRVLSTPLQ